MDLVKIYEIVTERDKRINSLYKNLGEFEEFFSKILEEISLPKNGETIHSITQRFVNLREDAIVNMMKKEGFSDLEIEKNQIILYNHIKTFWLKNHIDLIEELKPYLTTFYYELFKGIHNVGVVFSDWQIEWTTHIINTINRDLLKDFNGDEEKIFEMLRAKELFDRGHEGEADRCYSVLVKDGENYQVKSYSEFFNDHIQIATTKLQELIIKLSNYEDEYKKEWLNYLSKINDALLCKDRDKLVKKWSEVDIAWMDIKSPIQVGHPLEYYEDHFRKAVALELDIRVTNPNIKSVVKDNIILMYKKFNKHQKTLKFALQKIDETQLYLGRPAVFYGAELNGLFSAQVVPNDEVASSLKGKKIFAFADKILEDSKSKPKMRISYEVFGNEFMDKQYKLLENSEKWHKIYDITTIGHEFGHILWLDSDTEAKMNGTGAFKNVEEFKATTGGLMAFFENEDIELKEFIFNDTIKRAVGLIAWQEIGEVLPYYIEGLIHLNIMFRSGMLDFEDGKLIIDYNENSYQTAKKLYKEIYLDLVENYYIPKIDPKGFLDKFIQKEGSLYFPIDKKINRFVKWYYKLYKKIGQITKD
jgi:hypothetical protein